MKVQIKGYIIEIDIIEIFLRYLILYLHSFVVLEILSTAIALSIEVGRATSLLLAAAITEANIK